MDKNYPFSEATGKFVLVAKYPNDLQLIQHSGERLYWSDIIELKEMLERVGEQCEGDIALYNRTAPDIPDVLEIDE